MITELRLPLPESLVDPLEAYLLEGSGCSNWSLFRVRVGEPCELRGYFEEAEQAEKELALLSIDFPALATLEPKRIELEDREWQEAYKEFLQPWSSEDLHWVPAWMRAEYALPEGHQALYLDAGMAFGTGAHETTRLCARRLLDFRREWPDAFSSLKLVDAGCGSGILALSALKLGVERALAFDRDPEAVRVTAENIVDNGLEAERLDLLEAGLEEGLKDVQAELLLANIQADVLRIYAEVIIAAVAPGGWLVLSGILAKELAEVAAHFRNLLGERLEREDSRTDGEWSDLLLVLR